MLALLFPISMYYVPGSRELPAGDAAVTAQGDVSRGLGFYTLAALLYTLLPGQSDAGPRPSVQRGSSTGNVLCTWIKCLVTLLYILIEFHLIQ